MNRRGRRPLDSGRILWMMGTLVVSSAVFSAHEQITVLGSWAKADGQVTGSEIVRKFSPKTKPVYSLRVTFQYQANGVPQIAVSSASMSSSDLASVSRKVALYPAGSHHTILYDPANPALMRFDAGYNTEYLAQPLLIAATGLMVVIAGTIVRILARRAQRSALR